MFHVKPFRDGVRRTATRQKSHLKSVARVPGFATTRHTDADSVNNMIYMEFFANIDSFLAPKTVNMAGHNFWIEHGPGQRLRFQQNQSLKRPRCGAKAPRYVHRGHR